MPNLDPTQIRVAANGAVWKAPAGTPLPTDSVTAYNAGFTHLGYATDGFTLAQNLKTTPIQGWQTLEPLLVINASRDSTLAFESLESDKQNYSLAFSNSIVTNTGVAVGGAVTFTAGTITTATPHGLTAGTPIFFTGVTGTPGVVSSTTYWVLTVPTTTTITVAAVNNGAPITISTGTATAVSPSGPFTVSIPDTAIAGEFVIGVDWSHGNYSYRYVFPRVALLSLPTLKYTRADVVRYPVSLQILKPVDGSQSVLLYGNDWAANS